MHLQIHAKEADSRTKDIVFHALCVLYLLSVAAMAIDIADHVVLVFVSDNASSFLDVVLISFAEP